ncbi:hypothetical protein OTU49_000361 [Cherax quadricarinatus]|uniref:Uncharacterized protein n=1 Tax=Cherax quadricarinatus TaxID=27406 RepID=A0AAW0Y0R2_CHEQU
MTTLVIIALCLVLLFPACEAKSLLQPSVSLATTPPSVKVPFNWVTEVRFSQSQPTRPSTRNGNEAPSYQMQRTGLRSSVNCIAGSSKREDVMEVPHEHNQFLVNISVDFRYLEISLKIGSCSHENIYGANRFLTKNIFHLRTPKTQTVMKLDYIRLTDGAHAYHLTLDNFNFSETISSSVKCGELRGFRVKAKGASVCNLRLEENSLGVRVGKLRSQARDPSKSLHDLHSWRHGAYVIAICFTFVSYLLFLVSIRLLRNYSQYEFIISERYIFSSR